ncbi:MAG: acetyl-CoA carboxylase biotin carboxyl carrier protein subunit [Candidatus Cyclonatronum sp.]|uniref:acetyl-CoA carboxylase biotin carboxyl carrier protein subunit n=1 Tax=Cyclonatronum sp. TaxID=3024185 RepID=UPI0025BA8CFE|nr:acetyl-CoA carboxylase biotin carboxyl carrier protein subunit [Cyclonatronum sp.]MCH8486592.1 acetyl-CoA carboxylase biotin carboxyl carrier protein subunit [Cyclonatronum sp.]
MTFETTINKKNRTVEILDSGNKALIDGEVAPFSFERLDATRYILRLGYTTHIISNITKNDNQLEYTIDGKWHTASVKDEQMMLLDRMGFKVESSAGEGILKAPMPGKIVAILVEEGAEVAEGQPVVILEAMKMENELKSPSAGRIKSISAAAGQSVEKNGVLLEIEPLG